MPEEDRANFIALIAGFAEELSGALNTQKRVFGDDVTQLGDIAGVIEGFLERASVESLGDLAKGWAKDSLTELSVSAINKAFGVDGVVKDIFAFAQDPGGAISRITGSFAGEAFKQIAGVLQGGQDVYLALVSSQVQLGIREAREARLLLGNQIRGCNAMLIVLENIYGDSLYRMLDANRRVAAAFLKRAEATMDYVATNIDERGVFDHVRYNYGMKTVTGAQAALSAGARRDRILARGIAGRQEPTSSVLGSLGGIISQTEADEFFEQAVEDVRQALREGGDATVDAVLPFDLPDALTETVGALAGQYLDALGLAKDMLVDGERLLITHRRMQLRVRALLAIEGEIGTASQSMAHVADEIEEFSDRLERLRRDLESATGRAEVMAQTPLWLIRLSFMREAMEATITPSTLSRLQKSSLQGILNEEYNELIEDIRDIGLPSVADVEELTREGRTVITQFEQALSGRDGVPEGLVRRILAYRTRLFDLQSRYSQIDAAMQSVPTHEHDAVNRLNRIIDDRSPLLDGLRYLIDGGQWTTLGQFNAQLVTSAGLLAFTLRRALFGVVLPPDLQNLIDRVTEFLTRERDRANAEIAMRQEGRELLGAGIEATQTAFDRVLPLFDRATEIVNEYDKIIRTGEGVLGQSTETTEQTTLVLALG